MIIFYYKKEKYHTSADTDWYIKRSLELWTGISDYKILRDDHLKPYVYNSNIQIGVTHTNNLLIIALSNYKFGIDAEPKLRCINNTDRIIKRYFSEKEAEYATDTLKFLDIWVKKEAYLKFLGVGIYGLGDSDTYSLKGNYRIIDNDENIIYLYSENDFDEIHINDMR